MGSNEAVKEHRIGIYVRESRDDNEKNYETIETQRDLLFDYALQNKIGKITAVYIDDNVSGSSFERDGLNRLKEDAVNHRIDIVLIKDLSRLGRSNSKTLVFLDFLEENGVRVITCDNRYDSMRNDDTVGIETWFNERYVRDISRKIRASLRFKIEKGEFLGRAPYGYRKAQDIKNKLEIDPEKADNVRTVFCLYRQGYGYSSIAAFFNTHGVLPPLGGKWSGTAVRRILCNSVYTGETVQGVSERISFKSRKARRLPAEKWVVTADTHEEIISKEEFLEAQKLRESKKSYAGPHKKKIHILRGIIYCGSCGSAMYARKRGRYGLAYVCGNYYKNGRSACTSHLVYEKAIVDEIGKELQRLASLPGMCELAAAEMGKTTAAGSSRLVKLEMLEKQLCRKLKQKELAYTDRLEGRIDLQLFEKISKNINNRIDEINKEIDYLKLEEDEKYKIINIMGNISELAGFKFITNEIARCIIDKVIVFDIGDNYYSSHDGSKIDVPENGMVVIEFKYKDL